MNLFDYFFAIFCISGFTYHLFFLFREYLSGKTVVNLKIGHNYNEGLPAITLCPGSLSLDKLANISPYFRQVYDNYTHLINARNKQAQQTYYKTVNHILDSLDNEKIDIDDLFYNYSILPTLSSGKQRFGFTISAGINLKSKHPHLFKEAGYGRLEMLVEPISSIQIEIHGMQGMVYKCFTFFSHLDNKWKSVDVDSNKIQINIVFDFNSYPLLTNPIALALHSPNDLPIMSQGNLKPIRNGEVVLVQYSQIKAERLGPGYDTDCRDYNLDYGFQMRVDCLAQCYQEYFMKTCNSTGIAWSSFLIRENVLRQRKDRSFRRCSEFIQYKQDTEITCSSKCKFECQTKYYSTNIIKVADWEYEQSIILIEHNEMPNIMIEYMAETSFISFICNLGGLLGMWLGLSFYNSVNELKLISNNYRMKNQAKKILNMVCFNFRCCHGKLNDQ